MTTMTTAYQLLETVREGSYKWKYKFLIHQQNQGQKTILFYFIKYVPGVPAVAGAAPGRTNRPPSWKLEGKKMKQEIQTAKN